MHGKGNVTVELVVFALGGKIRPIKKTTFGIQQRTRAVLKPHILRLPTVE